MGHNIDEKRIHFTEKQRIKLDKFDTKDWVLDIGGGGEGVIGQLLKDRVISIDPNKRELEEAPSEEGVLKIVMDAKELKFLDKEFSKATSFFTMMYIESEDKEKVFREIYRVLKPEGEFLLWDATIPRYDNGEKDIYAILLSIELDDKVIETGYGGLWPGREQTMELYTSLGRKVGFKVIEENEKGETYFIKFKK